MFPIDDGNFLQAWLASGRRATKLNAAPRSHYIPQEQPSVVMAEDVEEFVAKPRMGLGARQLCI
jgi:hypothetical protein